jgi:hypothetical protein
VGRYQLYLDSWGSIEAAHRVVNNDFEGSYKESYFYQNPEWWVHGVIAPICAVGAGNLNFHDNRTEGISLTPGVLGELHLVGCQNPSIKDNTVHKIVCTSSSGAGGGLTPRTRASIDFVNTNHYNDLTDQRNYNCGNSADFNAPNDSLTFNNNYNMLSIIQNEARGITGSGLISCEMVAFEMLSYPTKAGTYARILDVAASPTKLAANNYFMGASLCTLPAGTSAKSKGTAVQPHLYGGALGNVVGARLGYDHVSELELFGEAYLRSANPGVGFNDYKGITINRLAFGDMTTPANWLDTPLFFANVRDVNGVAIGSYETDVLRRRKVRYEFTAPPTNGMWALGDMAYNKAPSAGGFIGWVCVEAGTPGTWKGFGPIAA